LASRESQFSLKFYVSTIFQLPAAGFLATKPGPGVLSRAPFLCNLFPWP
jgi:hypothetical protein